MREERALDRREIAVTDDRDRLIGESAQAEIVESVQDARCAIAAAHRKYDVWQRPRCVREAVEVGRALGVSSAEALETPPRRIDVFQAMPFPAQSPEGALHSRRIVRIARRRDEVDGA